MELSSSQFFRYGSEVITFSRINLTSTNNLQKSAKVFALYILNFLIAYLLKFFETFFENILIYKNRYINIVVPKATYQKRPFHFKKMPPQRKSNSLKTRCSAILRFSNNGHRSPAAISRITKTPLRIVKYNITKIKQQGTIEDRPSKGRPRMVTTSDSIALGQWIRRNNKATSKELTQKLLHDRALNVSRWTVQRQLKRMGYKSTLPYATPMLTQEQKHARVQWAIQHKDDDWSRSIFTDETCYQLFRNTIRRWLRKPSTEVKRIPQNKWKIMVWGGISIKGLIGYHSFKTILDVSYYVQILQDHLTPNARRLLGRRW